MREAAFHPRRVLSLVLCAAILLAGLCACAGQGLEVRAKGQAQIGIGIGNH